METVLKTFYENKDFIFIIIYTVRLRAFKGPCFLLTINIKCKFKTCIEISFFVPWWPFEKLCNYWK